MKKYLLLLLLIPCISSYAQTGYVGLIYDQSNPLYVRPYVVATFEETKLVSKTVVTTVLGTGINSLGSFTAQLGFDTYTPVSKSKRVLIGAGVEFFGLVDVYKEYLPAVRFGLEGRNVIWMLTSNYIFNPVVIRGVNGYEPVMKLSGGVFFRLKK